MVWGEFFFFFFFFFFLLSAVWAIERPVPISILLSSFLPSSSSLERTRPRPRAVRAVLVGIGRPGAHLRHLARLIRAYNPEEGVAPLSLSFFLLLLLRGLKGVAAPRALGAPRSTRLRCETDQERRRIESTSCGCFPLISQNVLHVPVTLHLASPPLYSAIICSLSLSLSLCLSLFLSPPLPLPPSISLPLARCM